MPAGLVKAAALFLGICAAGLVLLVLGSTPAAAASQSQAEPAPSLSDLVDPASDLIRDGLGPFGNVNVKPDVSALEEPVRVVDSLNGSDPVQGSTRVVDGTVGTTEGVLGATAGAPRALLDVAGSAFDVQKVTEGGPLSTVTAATESLGAGAGSSQPLSGLAAPGEPSSSLAEGSAGPFGLYAPGRPVLGTEETVWLRPAYGFGAPASSPVSYPPPDAARGPHGGIPSLPGSVAKTSAHAGPSADNGGGTHLLAGTVPTEDALTPPALFILANQPRRHLRSPVFPPLVPPG